MKCPSKPVHRAVALLACALALSACANAATVSFQQHNYTVTVVPLGTKVPASLGCDLIFVILPNNQKYLCIPTDPTVRGVFDPNVQRFYRVDRTVGLINGFTALSSTLINLNGTFFATNTDTPPLAGNGQSTLESYTIPLNVNTSLNADIAILDSNTLDYRTNTTTIYEITRTTPSIVLNNSGNGVSIPIQTTGPVAVDFDAENGTNLIVQTGATDANNNPLPDRISSYLRGTPAQFFDQITLTSNPAIPGYTGNASGIAYDVDNSNIYLLDGTQIIVFTLQRPTLTSLTPNQGPVNGGVTVTIAGANIPSDAIVFFDNIQALNTTVVSQTQITCNPPAHALGTVPVTMTGTGIIPGSPVTLMNAFTYVDIPPVAVLSASPTQGPTPLSVLFNVGASSDANGTIASRVINFGDGTSFTFSSDLTATTTTHTYSGNGTFTATLTVTDTLGMSSTSSLLITVGTGGSNITNGVLVLRQLTMKIQDPPKTPPANADQLSVTGEILLPLGVTPATLIGGQLTIQLNGITVSSAGTTLSKTGGIDLTNEKFTLKAVKTPGTASGTYAFTYSLKKTNLYTTIPTFTPATAIPKRFTMPISLTLLTPLGRSLAYGQDPQKLAVVSAKQNKSGAALTLVRN